MLLTLANIAITLAGFSAVVIMLKRRADDTWLESDAIRFMGMVMHAGMAVLFALLPGLLEALAISTHTALRWSSGALALQVIGHAGLAGFLEWGRGRRVSPAELLLTSLVVVVLLLLNVFNPGSERAFGFYMAGVLWHLVQALLLFFMLVAIPGASIHRQDEVMSDAGGSPSSQSVSRE